MLEIDHITQIKHYGILVRIFELHFNNFNNIIKWSILRLLLKHQPTRKMKYPDSLSTTVCQIINNLFKYIKKTSTNSAHEVIKM